MNLLRFFPSLKKLTQQSPEKPHHQETFIYLQTPFLLLQKLTLQS